MSADGKLVWSVNPDDDSVSVIRTDQNKVVKKIKVGNEPQGVALDPVNRYAYVVNAAGNSLTVIRITERASPGKFKAAKDGRFGSKGTLVTGSEPWNVVASPDGKRVYVANSGQDTISVLDVATRKLVGDVDLRKSLCNAEDKSRTFQPRGMAITGNSKKLYVTRFLSYVNPGGQQATDTGRSGVVCRLNIQTGAKGVGASVAQRIKLAPQITGFKIDSTGDATPDDTSAFPNQLQSIVIRNNQAYLPNIAASPSGPLRFNGDTQAFVNVIDGVNGNTQTDASAAKFLNLNVGAQEPAPGKKKLFFSNVWAIAFAKQRGLVVSAGSDLLVKVTVAGNGKLNFTGDANTTRLHRPERPGQPAHERRERRQEPAGHRHQQGRDARLREQLRLAQRQRGQPAERPGHQDDPHDQAGRAGIARRGDRGRRRDVLLLARQLQPPRGHDRLHDGAALQRRLAGLLELPLQGPDRRRHLVVPRRAAQVDPAQLDLQSAATGPTSGSSTTRRSATRSRTSSSTSATCRDPGPSRRRSPAPTRRRRRPRSTPTTA